MNNEQHKATRTRTLSRGDPEGLPYRAYRTYLKDIVILHSRSSELYILFIYSSELLLALVDDLVRLPVSVHVMALNALVALEIGYPLPIVLLLGLNGDHMPLSFPSSMARSAMRYMAMPTPRACWMPPMLNPRPSLCPRMAATLIRSPRPSLRS